MLTKLYLDTTNPTLRFSQLFSFTILFPMILSVIFHTILYTLFCNAVSYIFLGKCLNKIVNTRLVIFLLLVMFFGFIARFFHVKEIYHAYNQNLSKTREHLDKLYIGWIFLS